MDFKAYCMERETANVPFSLTEGASSKGTTFAYNPLFPKLSIYGAQFFPE